MTKREDNKVRMYQAVAEFLIALVNKHQSKGVHKNNFDGTKSFEWNIFLQDVYK